MPPPPRAGPRPQVKVRQAELCLGLPSLSRGRTERNFKHSVALYKKLVKNSHFLSHSTPPRGAQLPGSSGSFCCFPRIKQFCTFLTACPLGVGARHLSPGGAPRSSPQRPAPARLKPSVLLCTGAGVGGSSVAPASLSFCPTSPRIWAGSSLGPSFVRVRPPSGVPPGSPRAEPVQAR